jgi:hypothetical protein
MNLESKAENQSIKIQATNKEIHSLCATGAAKTAAASTTIGNKKYMPAETPSTEWGPRIRKARESRKQKNAERGRMAQCQ